MSCRVYFFWSLRLQLGIDPDFHPLQNLNVFVSQIQGRLGLFVVVVTGMRAQADLQSQRQFHFVAGFSQPLNGLGNLG